MDLINGMVDELLEKSRVHKEEEEEVLIEIEYFVSDFTWYMIQYLINNFI